MYLESTFKTEKHLEHSTVRYDISFNQDIYNVCPFSAAGYLTTKPLSPRRQH
jgi:hypothetical protein